MATNVHLTPELEAFANDCVHGGTYDSVSEVVRSALRLLKEQEDRKRAFAAMIDETIRETKEKGACSASDALRELDAIIEAAEQ